MTGDPVKKETMVFAELTDLQMANKVRMLMRDDLDHEAVCVGARDRIMYLSQQLEAVFGGKAPTQELAGTFPVVLYLGTSEDRDELISLMREAKPGMITRSLAEAS